MSSKPYHVLDLFSGIGGFSLGLERTGGFKTVAFCEIEPFCRRVLAKHWPEVPCYDDVRTLTVNRLTTDGISVDVICGGFPCQDISQAGLREGLGGARSGLWAEFARLIRSVRPDWAIVENVPGLRTLGADVVFDDLEAAGYASRPMVVGAWHAGAPHRRNRVWIVANTEALQRAALARNQSNRPYPLASTHSDQIQRFAGSPLREQTPEGGQISARLGAWRDWNGGPPDIGRVDDGIPKGLAEKALGSFGNTVLPQIPELIGRAILAMKGRAAA